MSKLVIVESPAKAKTIKKYLGSNFEVVASMGHIRDLPKSKLGVDVDNHFEPQYVEIKGKEDLIKSLKKLAKKSEAVYLATDPDREGEAISWHLAHILNIDLTQKNRVTFNEITKTGVKNGMDNARQVDQQLVDAQQARRILDRIVGYKLSPFLWRKVRKGLSAGRVQSVCVKIIVEREQEIKAFNPKEYWSIDAKMTAKASRKVFESKLATKNGKKFDINNEEEATAILKELENCDYVVDSVKKSLRKRSPAPPFITSTLQQDASRKLGYQSRKTMKIAQELYEGVELKSRGLIGLITYMRTDSLRISDEAMGEAEQYINEKYGKEFLPEQRRVFKSKGNAQDGHEAIRPSVPSITPDSIKESLTTDQYKLYKLVWERFMASQMANALYDTVSVTINAGEYQFKSSGFVVKFEGFTVLYEESVDEKAEKATALPIIEKGEILKLKEIIPNQHFTQPPPRFSEATLIKALEENGIGRPSTYAPTISTILARFYIEREGKVLIPTALGEVITNLMKEQFSNIVDVDFTANMEKNLDEIEEGNIDWVKTMENFYGDFIENLELAEKRMEGIRIKVPDEQTDVICDLCGKNMVIKTGRFGKFLACPGFPECKNTKKIAKETGANCPLCNGKILAKKSAKGRGYFGCEKNPECTFMTWDKPLLDNCPKCRSSLFKKAGKNSKIICLKEGCEYETAAK